MENELKIEIPKGYSVDKVETQDGGIVLRLKQAEPSLPKTWEEFCKTNDVSDKEFYIDDYGVICNAFEYKSVASRHQEDDKNLLPNRDTAEAVRALCQLVQLRDRYNQGWVPHWDDLSQGQYSIVPMEFNTLSVTPGASEMYILAFKSKELAEEFLKNFKSLIIKASPLWNPRVAKKAYVPKHRVGDQLVNADNRNLWYTVLAVVDANGVPEYHVAVYDYGVEVNSRFIECERMDEWTEPAGPGPNYIGNKQ